MACDFPYSGVVISITNCYIRVYFFTLVTSVLSCYSDACKQWIMIPLIRPFMLTMPEPLEVKYFAESKLM